MEIRTLDTGERPQAIDLVWKVFLEFEAPEYAPEGVREFRRFLDSGEARDELRWWGAVDKTDVVGALAMRGEHISLFFVDKDMQRRGIGKALFQRVKKEMPAMAFTVNSSPFAVEIYRRLGFVPTDNEQLTNGIRYTPMVYRRMENHSSPV